MIVQKLNFPSILEDNEETYIKYLESVISSVDMDSDILLMRGLGTISVRIAPSESATFHNVLDEVKKFHTMLGIQVSFSKSMKAGANIFFQINFKN